MIECFETGELLPFPGGRQMEQVNKSSHSASRQSGSSAVVEGKRIRSGRWPSASSARSGSTKTVKISLNCFLKEKFLLLVLHVHNLVDKILFA